VSPPDGRWLVAEAAASGATAHPGAPRDVVVVACRSLPSADLFRGDREVVILHGKEQYRLRITRAGKLILTK
jgi:hemin uptake protein HemP